MLTKKFSVSKDCLEAAQEFMRAWVEENDIDFKLSTKILICTDEVVSNVVFYSGAANLEITCDKVNSEISITFVDDGKAFDPLSEAKAPDITASVEEREIGGLGIFMVKKMMKSVAYSRKENKNELEMTVDC